MIRKTGGKSKDEIKMQAFISFLFFIFYSFSFAAGSEAPSISFQELREKAFDLNGKKIGIRGFIYQTQDGRVILASETNLKSCCTGSSEKIKGQIVLEGDFHFPKDNEAVEARGVLSILPKYDEKGKLLQYYVLKEAFILKKISYFPGLSMAILSLAGILAATVAIWKLLIRTC